MGITQKLSEYKWKRYIMLITLFALIAIPMLHPLGLPIPITQDAIAIYNGLQSLAPGSVVVYFDDVGASSAPDLLAQFVAMMNHLGRLPVRVIYLVVEDVNTPNFVQYYDLVKNKKVYGTDYVYLGFIPGREMGAASLASNLKFMGNDYYGNKLDTMPIFNQPWPISTVKDVSAVVTNTFSTSTADMILRQWTITYNVPTYYGAGGIVAQTYRPYVPTQIKGMLNGIKGGAEYEFLIGMPGLGISGVEPVSTVLLMVIALAFIVNIPYLYGRMRPKKGGA